ncbi:MAG TPA: malto-oligosyltrehalose trehalohydrolase [Gemmata sp.]
MLQQWRPSVGAWPEADGVHFSVWAPTAEVVELIIEGGREPLLMRKSADGVFSLTVPDARPGTRYRYRIDGRGPFPDPASRFQPDGVHGPSEVVDPNAFPWTDAGWKGADPNALVIYELHVGTFTKAGTFAAATEMLPKLADLGITAVELMPLADFPGERGWGYDGVCLYAPARCYGRPDDLRRFVDAAHRLGLAVFVDVVYNHLGPDGNYLSCFSPFYFSTSHQTDWGTGPNFDGENSNLVEDFFVENALHWVHEYHIDGLRLDATHAIMDEGERHILELLTDRVHEAGHDLGRRTFVIAEDERNLSALLKPRGAGGFGMDGVWADDLHHQIRRAIAGDKDGYYADYTGSAEDIATTLRRGWFYCGQPSPRRRVPRGTDPAGIDPSKFVVCIQNHDQIGNRAFGERLNLQIDQAAYRAVSALLLLAPQTPLLFMGQEWGASSPFLYFTDHGPELGALVTEGRRKEFRHFAAFTDPSIRTHIPDPQATATFWTSKLNWEERTSPPYDGALRLYRDLLRMRKTDPALRPGGIHDARAVTDGAVLLRRTARPSGDSLLVLVAFSPGVVAAINEPGWSVVLTTQDDPYAQFPRRPTITSDAAGTVVHFPCPAAVVFRNSSLQPLKSGINEQ